MTKIPVSLLAAALWWGSLTAIGFMAVPLLFAHLPTPAMAGNMAAQLFHAQSWVSVVCAIIVLLYVSKRAKAQVGQAPTAIVLIVFGLLCALLGEYAVAPRIVARENLRLWHSVGSVLYLLQWLCAGAVLWRAGRKPEAP
ncbi:DUF4149 domain-containing protein [Extensimonas vulgaris]|uniref:Uncharacterized protein DUF4149 n=1 Tax=Extensimonas vulgaris TaxID=1031594 RepID=A0A369ALR0_9BURK|nr:DUF4149 domain-containing protein [Extensimonas vulgaris]RCX10329.1 uncharacterized protein DUF4149 [Extensimonas vulgaris]TWI39927.1 uncharacterized protein DUF4149 [Extensimonas vulgaris]TXD17463.1 DUF4149 domain-containing protein [Extensimonas vulgaris]